MPQSNILRPYIVTGLSPWKGNCKWEGAPHCVLLDLSAFCYLLTSPLKVGIGKCLVFFLLEA